MSKPRVIVEVHSGLVTNVHTNLPEAEVMIIDYDIEGIDDDRVSRVTPGISGAQHGEAYISIHTVNERSSPVDEQFDLFRNDLHRSSD